ncbi:MAG TPA: glycosyltransferase family 2 protein [Solirubrobacteraceae bacterium]|nr:glycosyltransferase family 2 protein [Solirubrobacteraceae bacterium]
MPPTITAVVVSFADPAATGAALRSLAAQTLAPVELLVVDNAPDGATARALSAIPLVSGALAAAALARGAVSAGPAVPDIRIVHSGSNLGYTRAANLAAGQASGEWLFFLNPDALAAPDCLARLLEAVDGRDVAVVGAQVLLPDGRINAGENPVNLAGFSWSGGYGRVREHGPARDVAAVSGAALLVRREAFLCAGGMCPYFFMYVDDTDLAWRLRLAGWRIRYCPGAVAVHDYAFQNGAEKWFYLERNRAWALLANLRLRTLALLAPLLLAAEAAVVRRAFSEGWLGEKVRAWCSLPAHGRQLIAWRRAVQSTRRVSDYEVLRLFCAGVHTGLLSAGLPRWAGPALARYRRALLGLLARAGW